MILEAPGIVQCHALGDVAAKVEFRSVEVSHSHLPPNVTTGDVSNGL